ncbi:MAG: undecaprenyl/decaprenyl-phosphate alpha-N-acetylglucosaminyl 1-phosphate transferase [Gammaproteobacteria bacterium]|nr:undecaprenyl/decaprenyl-phosphate alpha-N-acetylglucosaminyl 1-phosphate transferase [Gammaproteobacteria bacterium]
MTLFLSFILGMMITVVLIPPLIKMATKWRIVDVPDERKIHLTKVPRIGGVAMLLGTALPVMLLLTGYREIQAYVIAIIILLLFGALDDKYNIDYKWKFLGQLLATLVVIFYGNIVIDTLSFLGIETLPAYISVAFTIFALLGVTNAINMSDGLDGLAGGLSLLSLGGIALIAYATVNNHIIIIALAGMGSILGFLRFNTYPARIFMGDTGSQFLGFTLGVTVILLAQQKDTSISSFIPLLVLGLPIIDTLQVMTTRLSRGVSPFKPDKNHIHHQLLMIGFNHYESVLIIYIIQSMLVGSAYVLLYAQDLVLLGYYVLIVFLTAGILFLARRSGWRIHAMAGKDREFIKKNVHWLQTSGRFRALIIYFTLVLLAAYLIIGMVNLRSVPVDTGVLSMIMLMVLFAQLVHDPRKEFNWLDRVVLYTLSTMVVYVVQNFSVIVNLELGLMNMIFAGLLLTVVLGFRYASNDTFVPTLLDVLILLMVAVLLLFPEIKITGLNFKISLVHIVVLFYAIELILSQVKRNILYTRAITAITLFVIAGMAFIRS